MLLKPNMSSLSAWYAAGFDSCSFLLHTFMDPATVFSSRNVEIFNEYMKSARYSIIKKRSNCEQPTKIYADWDYRVHLFTLL